MSKSLLLDLNRADKPMKLVYQLKEELKENPARVALAQKLTLDKSKPLMGLKGTYGLFGTDAWWENIYQREMPLLFVSGVIERAYCAGQDSSLVNNMIDVKESTGEVRSIGIYTNDEVDVELFREGAFVEIAYALDELKNQPGKDGGVNYSKVAIEMAVSVS